MFDEADTELRRTSRKDNHPAALPNATDDERIPAPELLHDVETEEGADEVDRVEDGLGHVRTGETDALEDLMVCNGQNDVPDDAELG